MLRSIHSARGVCVCVRANASYIETAYPEAILPCAVLHGCAQVFQQENGQKLTLREVFQMLKLDPDRITLDSLDTHSRYVSFSMQCCNVVCRS